MVQSKKILSKDDPIDPMVLDRILLLQSLLHVSNNIEKLAELCCSSLVVVPSVHAVAVLVDDRFIAAQGHKGPLDAEQWEQLSSGFKIIDIKMKSLEHPHGEFRFAVDCTDHFALYQPYIQNTANLAALIQDIWIRDHELENINRDLERQVRIRTKSLEESEARLRTVIEHAPEAIVVLDTKGNKFVEANQNAAKLFDVPLDELLQSTVMDFSPEFQPCGTPSAEIAMKYINEALAGGAPVFEWTHNLSDGTPVLCMVRLVRLVTEDRHLLRGSITDISSHRQLEEQVLHAGKMEALGQLSGGIAHDFNNILITIMGNTELLMAKMPGLTAKDRKMLNEILSAADRGAALSKRLLTFSSKQDLRPKPAEVSSIVENMVEILSRTLNENIEVVIDNPRDLWQVQIDKGQFESAILNLTLNARDAMANGGTLTIATRNQPIEANDLQTVDLSAGDYVVLTVSDTGCGIANDDLSKVTEPFFTTKESGKGTGLGLSMVDRFAKQSNGILHIESNLEEGTRVSIFLPRNVKDTIPKPNVVVQSTAERARKAARILVVEDDTSVQDLIEKQLVVLGYVVKCATDAEQAQTILESSPNFDLLLVDVMLPGDINGPKLAEQAKSMQPDLKILFCTGYAEEHFEGFDKTLGPIEFILKPFKFADLAAKVLEVLNLSREAND